MVKNEELKGVKTLISPILKDLNYLLVDLEMKNISGNLTLIVYIDKQDGITLDDCELVSKAIDTPLDAIDFTNGKAYHLSVSSPGLDRQVKNQYDFARNLGYEVEAKFAKPFEGVKSLKGLLVAYSVVSEENEEEVVSEKLSDTVLEQELQTNHFVLLINEKQTYINKNLTAKILPVIKF